MGLVRRFNKFRLAASVWSGGVVVVFRMKRGILDCIRVACDSCQRGDVNILLLTDRQVQGVSAPQGISDEPTPTGVLLIISARTELLLLGPTPPKVRCGARRPDVTKVPMDGDTETIEPCSNGPSHDYAPFLE